MMRSGNNCSIRCWILAGFTLLSVTDQSIAFSAIRTTPSLFSLRLPQASTHDNMFFHRKRCAPIGMTDKDANAETDDTNTNANTNTNTNTNTNANTNTSSDDEEKDNENNTEINGTTTHPPPKPLETDVPYIQIAEEEIVGIGGRTGFVYDVNKLKNNLVQKSVRQFKEDLLQLLMESEGNKQKQKKRRFNIEEKLAALVSANPVATTTDSNLLEGTWELAFATDNAVEILDEARFIYSRKNTRVATSKKETGNWKLSAGKMENPLHTFSRSIFLEDLEDDEDPFMVDTIRLFRGLWTIQRFYDIIGLSRTSLELVPSSKMISCFGKPISTTSADEMDSGNKELQMIYLDIDICVSMTGGDKDKLQVYTKNEAWIESRRERKHVLKATMTWLNGFGTPFKIRRKIAAMLGSETEDDDDDEMGKLTEEEYQILLKRVYDDKESSLMALRLGDYGDNTEEDETAWGGKDDPFVHLTADERQAIMKQMSIGEIKKAGIIQRRFAKKNKKRRSGTQKFKRPSLEDEDA